MVKRDIFFKKIKLDPNKRTIFFATSPSSIGPEDPDIIFEKMRFFESKMCSRRAKTGSIGKPR